MSSEYLESLSPSTGESVGRVPVTPPERIEPMVRVARDAQVLWRATTPADRAAMLEAAAADLMERCEEIGELMSREMGKPRRAAIGEVRGCAAGMAGKTAEIAAALRPEEWIGNGRRSVIHHDPFGVCAAITPWNYPVSMIHWLVVPALMAGNTVLLKPSEETPVVAEAYADALLDHLPVGVLQVVHGGEAQGRALVRADVDLIAFTGSREAGKHIMRSAADGLKRVILELGGKDPLIVLDDADVVRAAKFAAGNCFENSGQACISTERIFVHASVAEEFEARLAELAATVTVGDPLDDPDIGPMVNQRQLDHVQDQVREALERGARLVVGGSDPDGLFMEPTVLAGVTDEMSIAQAETFGPVACLTSFIDINATIEKVNAMPYALGAVVYGSDAVAAAVGRQLDAGMIGINRGVFGAPGTPWVGAKESGYGFHGSQEGHRQFTQTRVVTESLRDA